MKTSETVKTAKVEETFSAAFLVVLLLSLPMWGAVAMLVGSAIGLVAYALLFREQLRNRGWLKAVVIPIAIAALLGIAIAIVLRPAYWY